MEEKKIRIFKDYLEGYLNIFWLRPETAIWRAYDACILNDLDWDCGPSLDLCCGDGINSFIMCGGRFDINFDAYLSVMDMSIKDFFSGKRDIYNHPFVKRQVIGIARKPKRMFDCGSDWKNNSLQKAAKLGLYRELVCFDANKPFFKEKNFELIFSNAIYWLDDIDSAMSNLRCALRDDGKIIALMPSRLLKKHYIYEKYLKYGWDFCKMLDMGRYGCIKNSYNYSEWKTIFEHNGLRIKSSENYLSGRFIEISEIGLRPISKMLMKMANKLSQKDRAEIKREWIETLMYIIMPMVREGFLCDEKGDQAFFMFELVKK